MGLLGALVGVAGKAVAKSVAKGAAITAGLTVAKKVMDDDTMPHYADETQDSSGDSAGEDGVDNVLGVVAAPAYIIRDAIHKPDLEEEAKLGIPKLIEDNDSHYIKAGEGLKDHCDSSQVQHLPSCKSK